MKDMMNEFGRRVHLAVDLLEKYDGGEIVAHEHPIHLAIMDVEKLCRERKPLGSGRQTHCLPYPVSVLWYQLLDCSRGKGFKRHLLKSVAWDALLPADKKTRARLFALCLATSLSGMWAMLMLYELSGHDLPLIPTPRIVHTCESCSEMEGKRP